MRALTVKQPWASLIASGIKQVENRTYPVPRTVRGQRIAIHAGKGFDAHGLEAHLHNKCMCHGYCECDACLLLEFLDEHQAESKRVAGRILATARIVGQYVDGMQQEWFIDTPCWTCDGTGSFGGTIDCDYCEGTGQHFDTDWLFLETPPPRWYGTDPKPIYNWILADVELVDDPRIHRGMLGFWEVTHD